MNYNQGTTASSATGAANTQSTLWSDNIPGGGVNLHDSISIRADFSLYGEPGISGEVEITLNGVEACAVVLDGDGPIWTRIDLEIWRTGTTTGVVTGAGQEIALTGLSWGSQQVLAIKGKSNQQGGLILQRVGVSR